MDSWKEVNFDEIVMNLDKKRIPLSSKERELRRGCYRYFGAQGVIDYVDDFIFNGKYLLLAEDGENLKSRKQQLTQLVSGKFWVNNHAHIFQGNPDKCSTEFLYYLLNSIDFTPYITGSAQPKLSQQSLSKIFVKVPPLPTQQKIAQILTSLDDKIELNNKINANLEQQAQALFKSWFVDFEPFGGEMPAGWKVGTIGDLCSTVSQTYKGNDSEVVLINTSDVENGDILNHESVANSNLKGQFKKTFQRNDILYSEIRPANRHYAFVDIDETCNYIASTKLMVIRPKEDVNPHYLYHILTNPELIKEMQHLAETRSGTFPQITFESELSTYQIPLLPKEEQDKLGNIFEKIDNIIFHNIKENKKLSNLRDTLLPKLMNGEICL